MWQDQTDQVWSQAHHNILVFLSTVVSQVKEKKYFPSPQVCPKRGVKQKNNDILLLKRSKLMTFEESCPQPEQVTHADFYTLYTLTLNWNLGLHQIFIP